MSFEVRTEIAGLEPEAKRALVEIQTAVKREFAAQEQRVSRPKRHVTELHQSNVIAKPGQVVRVAPGDEDITVYMPPPDPGNGGEDIIISVEGDGTALGNVKVEPLNGTCENPGIQTLYNPGTYRYTSTGAKNESASARGGSWGGPAPTAIEELPDIAPQRLLGNNAVGTAAPTELTASQVLDWVDSTRGTLATRGASGWVGLDPGTTELPIVSKGPGADPVYQRLTNAGLATVPTATFKGRTSALTGDVEDLTATQATALLDSFAGSLKGLVPASLGGTVNYLRADGSFAVPPGTFLTTAIPVTSPILNTAGTIGFDQTVALGNNARLAVRVNSGGTPSVRRRLNVIGGTNVTVAQADDGANEEVDLTINATDTNTTYSVGDATLVLTGTAFTRGAVTGDVSIPAGSNVSAIGAGVIVDADVNAAAAIDLTKTGALTGDVTKASGSATTAIAAGVIVDADVNAAAAIALTKTGALTGDVTKASGSATTAIAAGVIVDADVNAAAAIDLTKTGALTGDVTKASGSATTAIGAGVIVDADVNASAAIAMTKTAALTGEVTKASGSATTAITRSTNFTWTGSHEFDSTVNFDHEIRLRASVAPLLGTGAINNLTIGNVNNVWLAFGATDQEIRGIVPPTASQQCLIFVLNISAFRGVLTHNDGSATAGNRMLCPNGRDFPLLPNTGVWLWYDTSQWYVLSTQLPEALQAEQALGTTSNRVVTPANQHWHPTACKFWVVATGGTASINDSYNVTSTTDTGVGQMLVTISADFSSANWCCQVSTEMIDSSPDTASEQMIAAIEGTRTAGSVAVSCTEPISAWSNQDPFKWHVLGFGDF